MIQPVVDRRNERQGAVMGLGEHLDDLRRRVLLAVLGVLPILIVALVFGRQLMGLILAPALAALQRAGLPASMQQTGLLELFSAWMYIAIVVTVAVGAPWILYQLWRFVAPGLYAHERRFAYVLAPMSVVLSLLGVATMYFIMLPLTFVFMLDFSAWPRPDAARAEPPPGIVLPTLPVLAADPPAPTPGQWWVNSVTHELRVAMPTADATAAGTETVVVALKRPAVIDVNLKVSEFIDLFVKLALIFVLMYQLPVVILILGWVGIVKREWLIKYRRHAIAGSVIVGAVVSPTGDPLSLFALQIPLYLLYELSIFLLWALPAKRLIGAGRGSEVGSSGDGGAEGPDRDTGPDRDGGTR